MAACYTCRFYANPSKLICLTRWLAYSSDPKNILPWQGTICFQQFVELKMRWHPFIVMDGCWLVLLLVTRSIFCVDLFCSFAAVDCSLPVCCLVWYPAKEKCSATWRPEAWLLVNGTSTSWLLLLDFTWICWCRCSVSSCHLSQQVSHNTLLQNIKISWNTYDWWSDALLG